MHHRSLPPPLFQVWAQLARVQGVENSAVAPETGAGGAALSPNQRTRPVRGGAARITLPSSLASFASFSARCPLDCSSLGLLGRLRVRRARLAEPSEGNGPRLAARRLRGGRSGWVAGQPRRGARAGRGVLPPRAAAECRLQRMRRGSCRSPRDGPARASSSCRAARPPWPS